MSSYVTKGRKFNGFVFHNQKLIQVVVVLISIVLLLTPILSATMGLRIPFLWTEEKGMTFVGAISTLVGGMVVAVFLLHGKFFNIKR